MIVLDLLWILMLWVVVGLLAAMVIGRASALGRGSENENATSAQPGTDAALDAPRRRHNNNRKRPAGSRNKNLADTNGRGAKVKQGKRAA